MKFFFYVALFSTLSFNAQADEHYKCYNLRNSRLNEEVSLTLKTSLFTKKIVSIDLISKIKASSLESVVNPFTLLGLSADQLEPYATIEASSLNFKAITKEESESVSKIAVSDSILAFKETGYAHYYSKACFWILDCSEKYEYFKCEKI
jgi:hypothetical protein